MDAMNGTSYGLFDNYRIELLGEIRDNVLWDNVRLKIFNKKFRL